MHGDDAHMMGVSTLTPTVYYDCNTTADDTDRSASGAVQYSGTALALEYIDLKIELKKPSESPKAERVMIPVSDAKCHRNLQFRHCVTLLLAGTESVDSIYRSHYARLI